MKREYKRIYCELGEVSRTKQSFKDECDINLIVKKFTQTGVMPHQTRHPPRYGDFSEACELAESIEKVAEAREQFMELPAGVRKAAENSPVRFLQMLDSDEGIAALESEGFGIDPVRVNQAPTEVNLEGPGEPELAPVDSKESGDKK